MLAKNTALEELDITLCSDTAIRERAYFDLEQGLLQNKTLRHFGFPHNMDEETPLHLASMFLEGGVSGLESCNRNANMFDYHEPLPSSIIAQWEAVLKNCEQLKHVGMSYSLIDISRDFSRHILQPGDPVFQTSPETERAWKRLQDWLSLNALEARRITREENMH
jgi:hypothetical protein